MLRSGMGKIVEIESLDGFAPTVPMTKTMKEKQKKRGFGGHSLKLPILQWNG